MDKITSEDIKVYGRLVSVSTEGKLADAEQIWDSYHKKNQQELNEEFKSYLSTIRNFDAKINTMFLGDIRIGGNLTVGGSITSCPASNDVYGMVKLAQTVEDDDNSKVVTVGAITPLSNRSKNNSDQISVLQGRVARLEAKVAQLQEAITQ